MATTSAVDILEPVAPATPPARRDGLWASAFIAFQFACQIGLLFEYLGAARVLMRSAAFGASLVMLLVVRGRGRRHPATPFALTALAIVFLSILHPTTNSFLVGAAHAMLYLSILAPLLWASRLRLTVADLRSALLILWLFHTCSAAVGVLQMHYPGRFQPAVSTAIQGMGEAADAYKMRLADGQEVWRPMGLTDTPGGAASAGLSATLFGLGFFLHFRAWPLRLLALAGVGVGLFCLYLGQVRSLLVMALVCTVSLQAILLLRGEFRRLAALSGVAAVLAVAVFAWGMAIGGQETADRLSTLIEDRPDDVYYRNRGAFLEHTFEDLLPQYPMGAGLGRWGMMRGYFGDERNLDSPSIWVEIQWTGWLLDGGVPLMVAYAAAVLVACRVSLGVALSERRDDLSLFGAMVLALNAGAVAVTFNYPLFIGQGGLEFWFLNTLLYVTYTSARPPAQRRLVPVPVGRLAAPTALA
jgi:hypothetical protein